MSDIVEKLRDKWQHSEEDCYAAADEIEKLRAALEDAANGFEVNGLYTRANKIYKVLDRE